MTDKCYFVKAKSISSHAYECRRLLNSWLIQSWWIANWGVQNEKSWTLQTCTTVSTIPVPCLQECKCGQSNRGIFPLIRCRYAEAHLILPILHTLPTTRACTYNTFVVVVVIFNTHHAAHRIDSSRTRGSNCTLLDDSNVWRHMHCNDTTPKISYTVLPHINPFHLI